MSNIQMNIDWDDKKMVRSVVRTACLLNHASDRLKDDDDVALLLRPGLFEDRHPALFEMKRNGLSRAAIEVHMMKQGAGRSSMWRR
jgi:hypothetical protein